MSEKAPLKLGPRDLFVAVLMNVMWGLNIVAVKLAIDDTGPITAAILRQIIVFAVCFSALKIVPGKMRDLILLGLCSGALFYIFANWSLAVSDNVSGLAIAGQLGVPFSLIFAVIFFGERIHAARIGGIILSFLGVVLLLFDPSAGDQLFAFSLMTIGSIFWAISSLIQRRLRGVPVLTIYAWIGLIGTIALIPFGIWWEADSLRALPDLRLASFGWIAFSAIGSTIFGHGSMAWLLQRHPITTVVPLTLVAPVISVAAASLFFDTPLTPIMLIGGTIALIGVALVTIRTAKAREQAE